MIALTAEQVREWDQYTISHLPISSIDLMEKAAGACVDWLERLSLPVNQVYYVFCGKGNNGGDGLSIARQLGEKGRTVKVFILEFGQPGTDDFQQNLHRLHETGIPVSFLQEEVSLPDLSSPICIVDALLGTGLNRPAEGRMAALINHINASGQPVCSIDMPSGMHARQSVDDKPCIRARFTLSFQCYKPALLLADNAPWFGERVLLDIGLLPDYLLTIQPAFEGVTATMARALFRPRAEFSHKGNFGHALLVAGSPGKMGAAALAARACLRCGPGLLSCLVPEGETSHFLNALPEAMTVSQPTDLSRYRTIGCGPGLGTGPHAAALLEEILQSFQRPMVWDADALNLLSVHPAWAERLPPFSIISPHPREFDRLTGASSTESERWEKAIELALRRQWIVLLKGRHTLIAMPGGRAYFNTSGNASMAKGGSGDVLTGMLTGLLTHGYAPEQTALLGVYLHGRAGELASDWWGMESVLASDICDQVGNAFREIGA